MILLVFFNFLFNCLIMVQSNVKGKQNDSFNESSSHQFHQCRKAFISDEVKPEDTRHGQLKMYSHPVTADVLFSFFWFVFDWEKEQNVPTFVPGPVAQTESRSLWFLLNVRWISNVFPRFPFVFLSALIPVKPANIFSSPKRPHLWKTGPWCSKKKERRILWCAIIKPPTQNVRTRDDPLKYLTEVFECESWRQ